MSEFNDRPQIAAASSEEGETRPLVSLGDMMQFASVSKSNSDFAPRFEDTINNLMQTETTFNPGDKQVVGSVIAEIARGNLANPLAALTTVPPREPGFVNERLRLFTSAMAKLGIEVGSNTTNGLTLTLAPKDTNQTLTFTQRGRATSIEGQQHLEVIRLNMLGNLRNRYGTVKV